MRRVSSIGSILLIAAFVTTAAAAKNVGMVNGKISDKDGSGLLGAVVTIFKQDNDGGTISFTRSDKAGFYRLTNLTPGNYYLQISRQGYQPLTNSEVKILPGKTTMLNIVLQEFINLISDDKDPRNWDLKTVMRSTSDRRLIFRDLPENSPNLLPEAESDFVRGGSINVASSAGLGSENYSVFPSSGQNGIVSNFAFTEPLTEHSQMILSGQLSSGFDSYWRVRNTFNYRPQPERDLKVTVGYGRMTLGGPSTSDPARPAQFLTQDPSLRDSGVQTVALGFEGKNKIMDAMAVEYGFDLSRVYFGTTKSLFSPYFQLIVTPADTWVFKSSMISRRTSDANSLLLPDGEMLNLMEPSYIAKINGDVHLSQFKHSELSLAKTLPDETTLEVAVFQDRMEGPGMPFLVSTGIDSDRRTNMLQLREDQTAQRGMRIAANRKFLDCVAGSIAYVYGSGAGVANSDTAASADLLARDLLSYVQKSYYHSLMGEMRVRLPRAKTNLTAAVRWYPGYSLTPMDLFSDRMDLLAKGINFSIRQPIPLPDFLGTTGRWEALLDVRNLLDQGATILRAGTGDLLIVRNPRSLRFGINLNLY